MTPRAARILRMSGHEVLWRARAYGRRVIDRAIVGASGSSWDRRTLGDVLLDQPELSGARTAARHGRFHEANRALAGLFVSRSPRFLIGPRMKGAVVDQIKVRFPDAAQTAAAWGDRVLSGEIDLLGYRSLRFETAETRIDWHLDPVHGRRAPVRFWSAVPYLDPACGDHKIVWELNRHQHWIRLGRAFWLTGNVAYRDRVLAELMWWMEANPPLIGINWASALELGLRSLSWVWALHLLAGTDIDDPCPWIVDLLIGVDRQLAHVETNLSYYFSPNTHLLGEALSLYIAGRALPLLSASARREAIGRRILVAEMSRQIASDGGHCERSTHYHRYTLDFYLMALAVARITEDPIAAAFESAVARLAAATRLMADATGTLPHFGDDDAGVLMPLTGRAPDDVADSLATAAALVDRGDLRIGALTEEALWTLAHPVLRRELERALAGGPAEALRSSALPETGYYISRTAAGDHLVIDGGPHGYLNGGHAHADALSMTCSIGGVPLLIDAGTGCYTIDCATRDRLRSTAAHNTLELDGRTQSVPAGPFHWLRSAGSRVHKWRTADGFDFFDGSHDGYSPLSHRRRVIVLHGELVLVADFVEDPVGNGSDHTAAVHWHLDPRWTPTLDGKSLRMRSATDCVGMLVPEGAIDVFMGDEATGLGFFSPMYGRIDSSTTIRITKRANGSFWVVTAFDLNPLDPIVAVECLPIWSEAGSMRHGTALRMDRGTSTDYVMVAEAVDASVHSAWRVAEIETDAAALFCRFSRGHKLTRVALVDGSFVRESARPGARLTLGGMTKAFHSDRSGIEGYPSCAASPAL